MKKHWENAHLALALLLVALAPGISFAQQGSANNSVSAVVTVAARKGDTVPAIDPKDVLVYEGRDRDEVTNVIRLTGDRAGLQLFLLIDDGARTSFDTQLQELRQFILSQPPTTAIGIGYMRDGTVQVLQNPTTDHDAAARALRIPMGDPGASPSPYFSLVDLTKKWPAAQARREVLAMTDGVDRFYGGGPDDPYVDSAVDALQRAGIVVYSIYTPGAGHFGRGPWSMNWGQNNLSEVSERTGGEMYNIMTGAAVSFAPYLKDMSEHLGNQLLVSFIPKPEGKSGFRSVRFCTEVPNAELVGPDRVWVP